MIKGIICEVTRGLSVNKKNYLRIRKLGGEYVTYKKKIKIRKLGGEYMSYKKKIRIRL